MAELMDYVNTLSDQIGPRPVSTEEEHQASLYIAQELTDIGLDVSVDEFATPTGVRWPYALAFGVAALGTIVSGIGIFVPGIALSMYILGFLLIAVSVFVYYTEYNNQPFLSKMRAGGVSQNVVAKYIPSSVAREQRRRKVIIAAHVDTVRVQPEAGPQFIAHTPLLRKIIFYCMIGILAITFIRLLPLPWPDIFDTILWAISLLAAIYLLLAAGCIIASRFTPYISGGNDNASSVAVLLSVARRLLDPEERERYAMERPIAQDLDNPVETFAPQTTGPFAPIDDDLEEPVMHDEDEAFEAGLVPDGVEIEYDDDGERDDATVAFSSLSPEGQLDVLADAAAMESQDTSGTYSLDDVDGGGEPTQSLDAIRDIKIPELDFTLDDAVEAKDETVEKLDDEVIFAEYLTKEEDTPKAEVADEKPAEVSEETDADMTAADEAPAREEPADEEPPAPAPVYTPIKPAERPQRQRTQVARPVPSWYAAAKEKAAKDLEKKTAEEDQQMESDEPIPFRSRFADMPVTPGEARAQQEAEEAARKAAEQARLEAEQAAKKAKEAAEKAEAEPVNFDISDDELDELNPDASGLFPRIDMNAEGSTSDEGSESGSRGLTSRIPNIGSSDDKEREERKSVHEERAAQGVRPELESIPAVLGDASAEKPAAEETPNATPARQQRKKPTARHLTEEFTPTRAVDARDNHPLGGKRQEAPVSSTYEDTPQAAPEFDPFAPKEDRYTSEPASPARRERSERKRFGSRRERARSEFADSTAASRMQSSDFDASSPASTSSFPSLTGSFPALSGSMPVVDVDDFAEGSLTRSTVANDDAIETFMASGRTTEISIPESRFHNAVDKVGGLFGRKKKDRDTSASGNVENWDEDDDFGWKGGGYFDEQAESAYDAVRERAAQIRESVVSMTESDLLDKEVWFVALGASSAGGQGMKNFLDLHSSELRGSLIINLEAVGAGDLSYVDVEGTGRARRSDRRLQSLIKKASKELKGFEMKPKSLEWRNTDATPAMAAGMRAMTIMGFDENGVAPVSWHCAEDTADIVEEDNLEYVTRLMLKVIENS